ncbi:hypothetical protein ABZ746_23545 [Streptomyces sp. NPDC020096]
MVQLGRDDAVVTAPPRPGSERTRLRFPSTWSKTLCDACVDGYASREQHILRAFPQKLLRACNGHLPMRAVHIVRDELDRCMPVHRLVARIERRWWQGWTHRPLAREADEDVEGYGPDDVAVWLIAPTACRGKCEDGWDPQDPDQPCSVCQPRTPHRPIVERTAVASDMAETARNAARAAKLQQQRGEYVPAHATAGREAEADRVRQLGAQRRTRSSTKRRPEITLAEEQADPSWAAAVKRARQERDDAAKRR